MKLTTEQQGMVESVIGLIKRFCQRNKRPLSISGEDYYAHLALAVTKAAGKFLPGKASWPTYAWHTMSYARADLFDRELAVKRREPAGASTMTEPEATGCCPVDAAAKSEAAEVLTSAIGVLREEDSDLADLMQARLQGLTNGEIADSRGVTKEAIRVRVNRAMSKLQEIIANAN